MNSKIIFTAFFCLLCCPLLAQNTPKNNIIGLTITVQSEIMNDEREIQVFLPDNYRESDKKYPVLYILDGQRYFLHGVSLQKAFFEFEQTPEFIVVGISKKQSDRNRHFTRNSGKYLQFIKKEVIGHIDNHFRSSEERLLFGWAFGGGFTIQTMTNEPDLFDAYISASAFPLANKISTIDSLLGANPDFDKYLYFTVGTNEGSVKKGNLELNKLLVGQAPAKMNWTFRELQGEEHRSTPFTTLYHGIKSYFNYYPELQFNSLEEFSKAGGLQYIYDYYKQRAIRFGFANKVADWTMFNLTRNAIRANDFQQFDTFVNEFQKTGFITRLSVNRACLIAEYYLKNSRHNKAIAIFKPIIDKHPDAERPLYGLGDAHKALNEDKIAEKYYNQAKALSKKNVN